jgi:hypothetical protein
MHLDGKRVDKSLHTWYRSFDLLVEVLNLTLRFPPLLKSAMNGRESMRLSDILGRADGGDHCM